jgi:two-component system cell cycle sensor histidine kinase/response regulator CckA
VPVIQISASCIADADWVRGLDSGADNYLIEPVASEVVIGTLRQLLYRRRAELELRTRGERALAALSASERRYRDLFVHAPYGICTFAHDGRVLTANKAFADMFGYDSIDAVTSSADINFYSHISDRERILAAWRDHGRLDPHEVEWRRPDGQSLRVRLTGRRVDDEPDGADAFEVFVEDVTAQRRLEAEARQSQKMEAVGRLAAGIAHDFNNLLTAVLGYTELMLEDVPADSRMHADLFQIHTAGMSAASLTQQLLAFGRKQTQALDVNVLVHAGATLIRRTLGDDITVTVRASDALAPIQADRVQLEQVLLNLAINARDAMPRGGTLTIETERVQLTSPHPFPWPVRVAPGGYVRLTVVDTGCGMDAETRRQVFEPFFTTKGPGRGIGLGLATVYGIVKQLGDVVMPEMNGPELVQRLQAQRPALARIIYMSGYADTAVITKLFDNGAPILPKPFTRADLLRTTRSVLDSAAL